TAEGHRYLRMRVRHSSQKRPQRDKQGSQVQNPSTPRGSVGWISNPSFSTRGDVKSLCQQDGLEIHPTLTSGGSVREPDGYWPSLPRSTVLPSAIPVT